MLFGNDVEIVRKDACEPELESNRSVRFSSGLFQTRNHVLVSSYLNLECFQFSCRYFASKEEENREFEGMGD